MRGDDGGAVPLAESPPSVIVPLAPARILDTRIGATSVRLTATTPGSLQVAGTRQNPSGAPVIINSTAGAGRYSSGDAGHQWFTITGVVDAAGSISSIELGVRVGATCRVWGTITPAG